MSSVQPSKEPALSGFPFVKILKWSGSALIVLPLVLFLIWRGSVAIDINRLRQKSIDRGEPQTVLEMVGRFSAVKPEENAAEAVLDIWVDEQGDYWQEWRSTGKFERERDSGEVDPNLPFLGTTGGDALPWPEIKLEAARAFVASRHERNQKVRVALDRSQARYPLDYTRGFATSLPHLAEVKRELASYKVDTFLAIQEGRTADAMDSLEQMKRMTLTLKDEPFLISQLVRIACTAITLNGIEQLVSWQSLEPAQLKRLSTLVDDLQLGNACYQSMLAERAGGLSVFRMSAGELDAIGSGVPGGGGTGASVALGLLRITGISGADQRLMLSAFDQILPLTTNLTPTSVARISNVMDDTVAQARNFPPKIFTGMFLPAFAKAAAKFQRIESERRLTLIALSIEAYRLEHGGSLPENLELLEAMKLGEQFSDPFANEPIKFQPRSNGYLLYSVGEEGVDNQGQTAGKQRDISLDITHHYGRPDDELR